MPEENDIEQVDEQDEELRHRKMRDAPASAEAASLIQKVHNQRVEFPATLSVRQAIELLTNGSCGD